MKALEYIVFTLIAVFLLSLATLCILAGTYHEASMACVYVVIISLILISLLSFIAPNLKVWHIKE